MQATYAMFKKQMKSILIIHLLYMQIYAHILCIKYANILCIKYANILCIKYAKWPIYPKYYHLNV